MATRKKKTFRLAEGLARAAGLEPAISGVTGQRDNQLRYARVTFIYYRIDSFVSIAQSHFFNNFQLFFYKILRILSPYILYINIMTVKMLNNQSLCTLLVPVL